ncbi:MAG: hypothetical protein B6229_00470 [Spirochaetaceae bacterium 4572_7]|nr:MAG: hypothetical protein B6229_00470 [Spirochaetaceae bacterium 4572_7]
MTRALFYIMSGETLDNQLYMKSTAFGGTLGKEIDDILAGQSSLEVVTDEDIWSIDMDKFIYIIDGEVFFEDDDHDGNVPLTKKDYYNL